MMGCLWDIEQQLVEFVFVFWSGYITKQKQKKSSNVSQ